MKGRFKRCPCLELPYLGIDNMIRALFSSRLEITFLLDGLESRSAKLQIIELARYHFPRHLPYSSCTLSPWVGRLACTGYL